MYELWYTISGGSPDVKQMTWSKIINNTGPPIILSYTFQDLLKPYTNYSIGMKNHNLYNTSMESKKIAVATDSAGIQLNGFRRSRKTCSVKKGILRNFTQFTGKHLCQSLFCLRPATLLKKRLWRRCFCLNFVKFSWTLFSKNTSVGCFCGFHSIEWLPLKQMTSTKKNGFH